MKPYDESDRPDLRLSIDGTELSEQALGEVVSVEVVEERGRAGGATLSLRNWDSDENGVDRELISELRAGRAILIEYGVPGERHALFEGRIDSAAVQVARGTLPRLELRCSGDGSDRADPDPDSVARLELGVNLLEAELESRAGADEGAPPTLHGSATCDGDPVLRSGAAVEFHGFGDGLDGPYHVTAARHSISPGSYETHVDVEAGPAPSAVAQTIQKQAAATAPSIAQATVVSFADPEKQGRVQVSLPSMGAQAPAIWARLATPAGGAQRGFAFIPEPGDEVLVQFLHGDLAHPVVVGSLWNEMDAPPEPYDAERNDRRALVSRSGHSVVFDDGEEQPGLTLRTASDQTVRIDDTSGSESIVLADKTGNELKLEPGGISLNAATGLSINLSAPGGAIRLAANTIEASADATVAIAGNAEATFVSAGQARVHGGLLELGADAQVSAQAPMIKLN